MFLYPFKVLFSGFLQFNSNFVDAQNNSKYRDWAQKADRFFCSIKHTKVALRKENPQIFEHLKKNMHQIHQNTKETKEFLLDWRLNLDRKFLMTLI